MSEWEYDASDYIYGVSTPKETPGRPTCLEEGIFTLEGLKMIYARTKSVRKTAQLLGVSPTTVKKYLKGNLQKPGRPLQPRSWKSEYRSEVHKWFVEHRNQQLPRTTYELSRMSGFSVRQINRYLSARLKAMYSYLATLPPLNSVLIVFKDVNGNNVPTKLIRDYLYSINRITGDVTISCVLTVGGQRIIKVPFRQLETALRRENPDIPVIGLVTPLKPPPPAYNPYKPRWQKDAR